MLRTTIKSLLARKLRLTLSALAVVLGVAFVVGAFVLTDTLGHTFTDLFNTVNKNIAVDVRGGEITSGSANSDGGGREDVPAAAITAIQKVDGVAEVQGNVVDARGNDVSVLGKDGKALSTNGAPIIAGNWIQSDRLNEQKVVSGRAPQQVSATPGAPRGPTEVLMDGRLADKAGVTVGDTTTVFLPTGQRQVSVVGLVQYSNGKDTLGGESYLFFTTPDAQRLLRVQGYSDLYVASADGVSQDQLRNRVAAALPGGLEAVTGTQLADEQASDLQKGISFLNTFLLVFAAVALFVGAFIIFNTFSILVAQRTRELALLRALGASKGQVTRSVLLEAVVVGGLASAIGLGAGIGVAIGLQALFGAFGAGLPSAAPIIELRTVIAAFAVGIIITSVAALLPARRAAKVPPVAAMRDAATADRSLFRQTIAGIVLTIGGAVAMTFGLTGSGLAVLGLGTVLAFLGVALLSPLVSRPVTGALGLLFQRSLPGRLGRQNSLRNPRRTASTAAALMIGLALVAAVGVLGSSLKDSVRKIASEAIGADYIVSPTAVGMGPDAFGAVQKAPGVGMVTGLRGGQATIDGSDEFPTSVSAAALGTTIELSQKAGDVKDLGPGTTLISDDVAKDKKLSVGSTVPVTWEDGDKGSLRVVGVYASNQLIGKYLVDDSAASHFHQQLYFAALVKAAPGQDVGQLRQSLDQAMKPFPNIQVQNQSEFVGDATKQIDQLVQFFQLLLALSVGIAILGIVNTLALSVLERTRELGLLRAVGMSRRQVKRMVRVESVLVSVFGGLLGLAVGVVFGVALQRALISQGVTELSFPVTQLAVYLLLAAAAGMLAAWLPARRASRLNVLRAVATD
ncbi:MAG TPA: FtsX-like permease family protein [Mycobacteriales bacterium]|jgi:putative ABC transport system permease protein|nr:FtsX-like permease family protein [Mycobacteriales bacterium]